MKINENKVEGINAYLVTIFIFLSALSSPIIQITKSGLVIWASTLFIITISFLINNLRINFKFIIIVIVIFIFFLFNMTLVSYKKEVFNIFLEFIKFGAIPLYLGMQRIDYKKMIKCWYLMGILNLLIWIVMIPNVNSGEISYMTMGIYLTYSFIIFTYYYYNETKNRHLNIGLAILTLVLILIKSNRSSIIICGVILGYYELKNLKKKKPIYNISKIFIIVISFFVIATKSKEILIWINGILEQFGIYSYSISKFIMSFDKGIVQASSGRDFLYIKSLDLIINNNFMPNGVGYFQFITGEVYPHNIFLDLCITFGIFSILIIITSIIIYYKKIKKVNEKILLDIIISLTIFSLIRLNFSGMFWNEVPLWVLIGILINIRDKNKKLNLTDKVIN